MAGMIDFRIPSVAHSRKRRAITGVSADLIAFLKRLRRRTKGDAVVQVCGKPVQCIKRAFRYVADKAKLPHVTPHVLKHTFVSQALQVPATSIRTHQAVYGKHMVEDQRKAAEALAQLTRKSRANSRLQRKGKKRIKR